MSDRYASHLFQRINIDDGHRVRLGVGHVGHFAVGCERHPVRGPADVNRSQKLQIGKRVHVDRTVEPAIDHEGLSVGSDGQAVGRIAASQEWNLAGGQLRELDPSDFLVRREINDRKPVELGKLGENSFG